MKRPADLEAPAVAAAVAQLLELCGLEADQWQTDVLSLHVTHGTVGLRIRGRGPRGKLVPGVTIRRAHTVRRELPEDDS